MQAAKLEQAIYTQKLNWSPIVLGGLIALGLGFLLDLFANGIGLSLYTSDINGATKLAIGGFSGLLVASIATMFTAGYAAGYFAGPNTGRRNLGVPYGFAAWCLGLILMGMFSSHMGNTMMIGGEINANSPTITEIANTAHHVVTQINPTAGPESTSAEKNVKTAGAVTLVMFFLFFIGALSACLGGYFGFCHWEKKQIPIL